jgi:membrane protein
VAAPLTARVWRKWNAIDGGRLAAAVAFYAVLSLAPLVILIVAVGSAWLGAGAARHYVSMQVADLIGSDGAGLVDRLIRSHDAPSPLGGWAAWAGAAVLAVGATAAFAELQHALDRIFGEVPRPAIRELLRVRALSFLLVMGAGLLLGASFVASSVLRLIAERGTPNHAMQLGAQVDGIVSFGVAALAMAALLRVLPDRPPGARQVWVGALVGAALFAAGRYVVAWYVVRFGVGSAYGAAGTIVVLMAWIYFSVLVFLAGAVVACVTAPVRGAPGS